ncbi:MAG: 2-C-methyl-D-erythritol 4-phosphate cytidylyltransferase [Algicola sp.]|nr:2-C-methyl-D-erythritol 4-phosphate cytidylyltransferase [Algicola sp.]
MSTHLSSTGKRPAIYCVIPAAGVGKRMQANVPKQYLTINNKTILEHTVERLQSVSCVEQVVIAINPEDQYFSKLNLDYEVKVVFGGDERINSVLAGLKAIDSNEDAWVLVHDAARPNVSVDDIEKLVESCFEQSCGGILATPVRDTMKRGNKKGGQSIDHAFIDHTEDRENLWHALTPQFFELNQLIEALEQGLKDNITLTDEASAIENADKPVLLVEGRADNLKITRPEDLALATFYLNHLESN